MRAAGASLIFDCDGVIFDSNELKNVAFAEVVGRHYDSSVVSQFVEHHRKNGGVSRYVKFRHLFEGILHQPVDEAVVEQLLAEFSRCCQELYAQSAFTRGARECLEALSLRFPLYVASGSDEVELRAVFEQRGLSSLFRGIFGSPARKGDIVGRILAESGHVALMVGDAVADYRAAAQHGIRPVLMPTYSDAKADLLALAAETGTLVIESLTELPALIEQLETDIA